MALCKARTCRFLETPHNLPQSPFNTLLSSQGAGPRPWRGDTDVPLSWHSPFGCAPQVHLCFPQHQIPELAWKGPQTPPVPPHNRDTFCYPTVLQAPSNPALDTSTDGATPDSLDNWCQSLPTHIHGVISLKIHPRDFWEEICHPRVLNLPGPESHPSSHFPSPIQRLLLMDPRNLDLGVREVFPRCSGVPGTGITMEKPLPKGRDSCILTIPALHSCRHSDMEQ